MSKSPSITSIPFGGAAVGHIPAGGTPAAVVIAGKTLDPSLALSAASLIGAAVQAGAVNPVNALAEVSGGITRVQPGGRPLDEVPLAAREGTPYRPKDDWTYKPI